MPLRAAIVANVAALRAGRLSARPPGGERARRSARVQREQLARARQDYAAGARRRSTGKQQADAALQKFYKDVLPADPGVARKLTFTRLAQLAQQANVQLEHGTNG